MRKETRICNLMLALIEHKISIQDAIQEVLDMEIEGKWEPL